MGTERQYFRAVRHVDFQCVRQSLLEILYLDGKGAASLAVSPVCFKLRVVTRRIGE
jgi:hypothetical protein